MERVPRVDLTRGESGSTTGVAAGSTSSPALAPAPDRIKVFEIKSIPYREFGEQVVGIDNRSMAVRAARLFIRYSTRWLGYRRSATLLCATSWMVRPTRALRTGRYVQYLIDANRLRNRYLALLANGDLVGAMRRKSSWAELTLRDSLSHPSRATARAYLWLLARHAAYDGVYSAIDGRPCLGAPRSSAKKFYIYGPNADARPDPKYADYTLVLTKPLAVDVGAFAAHILFINSSYYTNAVMKNDDLRAELVAKYEKIYVSCRVSTLQAPFERAKFPIGDALASSMALGRILYDLLRRHGSFTCVIEGFDFYLSSSAYAAYYPTAMRDKETGMREQVVCSGLADHDALYSFLYAKELLKSVRLVDSPRLQQVIALDARGYLDGLSRSRDFTTLALR